MIGVIYIYGDTGQLLLEPIELIAVLNHQLDIIHAPIQCRMNVPQYWIIQRVSHTCDERRYTNAGAEEEPMLIIPIEAEFGSLIVSNVKSVDAIDNASELISPIAHSLNSQYAIRRLITSREREWMPFQLMNSRTIHIDCHNPEAIQHAIQSLVVS